MPGAFLLRWHPADWSTSNIHGIGTVTARHNTALKHRTTKVVYLKMPQPAVEGQWTEAERKSIRRVIRIFGISALCFFVLGLTMLILGVNFMSGDEHSNTTGIRLAVSGCLIIVIAILLSIRPIILLSKLKNPDPSSAPPTPYISTVAYPDQENYTYSSHAAYSPPPYADFEYANDTS